MRNKLITSAWAAAFLAGCIWGGFGKVIDRGETEHGYTVDKVTERPHVCGCKDTENTTLLHRCRADGTKDADGDSLCCNTCGAVCGKRPAEEKPHACDCDTTDGPFSWCHEGWALCCRTCGKACAWLTTQKKPPHLPEVPMCPDLDTHLENCRGRETCKVCHHPCPP